MKDNTTYLRGRMGDLVWWDQNGNGIQDAGEGGVAGVTVRLLTSAGAAVLDDLGQPITAVTDDNGLYDFKGLYSSSYMVEFVAPSGTKFAGQGQGGNRALDSDANATTGRTAVVALGGGQRNVDEDAGLVLTTPTRAVVGSFNAYLQDNKVVVNWQTLSEIGTAGYFLERQTDSSVGWVRINSKIVPALAESPSGGYYSVVDETALPGQAYTYRLIEVETRGALRRYGPYDVTATEPMPSSEAANVIASGENAARVPKTPKRLNMWASGSPQGLVYPVASRSDRLRIEVVKSGLYRIDVADIKAGLGLSDQMVRLYIRNQGLMLTNQGKTVSYLPAADFSAIYFYAEAIDSIYTSSNVYWLSAGSGATMATFKGGTSTAGPETTFIDTLHVEQNLQDMPALFHDPEADIWLWDYLVAGGDVPGLDSKIISVDAPDAVQGVTLAVSLQGMSTDNEHDVQVSLDHKVLGVASWSGVTAYRASFPIPADTPLMSTDNPVEIEALPDSSVDYYSMVGIDSLDLTYQRATNAVKDQLQLAGLATGQVKVGALSSAGAWVFDITTPVVPTVVRALDSGGGAGSAWVTFMATSSPALATGYAMADYVVITTDALYDSAVRLATYRAKQGLKTKVVTTTQIYDAFNYGIASPHAIQSFIAFATTRWGIPPRYVVLAGEGSYDYKNYTGKGDSLVPPLMTDSASSGLAASDVLLADVNNADGVPEVALGRIPALTTSDLDDALAKIRAYEATAGGVWQQSLLFAADNADEGGDFPVCSDALAARLPAGLNVSKAYLGQLSLSDARAALLGSFAGSTLLVDYVGHGGFDQMAFEGLLTNADVPTLGSSSSLPIVTALTCEMGDYGLPGSDSLAEALVKRAGAGAIAVLAPSAWEDNNDSVHLGGFLMDNLFGGSRQVVLGDVIRASYKTAALAGVPVQVLRTYNLLGDPALKVKW
jgi:hypothetical protein